MLPSGKRDTERRKLGLDGGDSRRRAGDVLLLADTRVTTKRRQPKRFALVDEAPIDDREPLLQPAKLEVVPRDVRCDADAHRLQIGVEALGVGRCGRHGRTDPSEDIQLPRRVERRAIRVDLDRLVHEAGDLLVAHVHVGADRDLRILVALLLVEDRPRLVHSRNRNPHVVVGRQRCVLELHEHGIVQLPPPARIVRLIGERRRIPSREGRRVNRRGRRRRVRDARGARQCQHRRWHECPKISTNEPNRKSAHDQ